MNEFTVKFNYTLHYFFGYPFIKRGEHTFKSKTDFNAFIVKMEAKYEDFKYRLMN